MHHVLKSMPGFSWSRGDLWLRHGMFHRDGPTVWELARQALSSVERGYDLLAPKFNLTPYRTPDALLAAVAAQLGPADSVADALDVCCGTGAALRFLRPLARERVVGVDLSQAMLDVARRRHGDDPGAARLELVKGDALALTFEREFDLVTSFGAFGHIEEADEGRLVAGIARALRPGGRFAFVTGDAPPLLAPRVLRARAFNAVMRVRNAVWKPPFVMYYLTFLLPRARALLEAAGLHVEVLRGVLPTPYERYVLVIATKP
jgi:SAM-dependent methyltransferase